MAYTANKGVLKIKRYQQVPIFVPSSYYTTGIIRAEGNTWITGDKLTAIYTDGTSIQTQVGFASLDELDRIRLHTTPEGALNDTVSTRLNITNKEAGTSIILTNEPNSTQLTLLSNFLNLNPMAPVATGYDNSIKYKLTHIPSVYRAFKNAESAPIWELQGTIEKWVLETSAPVADINRLGEFFGRGTKSVVTGSGTINFIFDYTSNPITSSIAPVLQLVFMTENTALAEAKFYIKSTTEGGFCVNSSIAYMTSPIYIETSILLNNVAIDMSSDVIAKGSANFTVNGPIRKRVERLFT